jgi:hypothetical protein
MCLGCFEAGRDLLMSVGVVGIGDAAVGLWHSSRQEVRGSMIARIESIADYLKLTMDMVSSMVRRMSTDRR